MPIIRISDCDFDCYSKDLGKGRGRGFRVYCRKMDTKCKPQWIKKKVTPIIGEKPLPTPEMSEQAEKEFQLFMAAIEPIIPTKKFSPSQLFPKSDLEGTKALLVEGDEWYVSRPLAFTKNIVDASLKKRLDTIIATLPPYSPEEEAGPRMVQTVLNLVEEQTSDDDPVWAVKGVYHESKTERTVLLVNCSTKQMQGLDLKVYKLLDDRCNRGGNLLLVGKYNQIVRCYCHEELIGFAMPVSVFTEYQWFAEIVRVLCKKQPTTVRRSSPTTGAFAGLTGAALV